MQATIEHKMSGSAQTASVQRYLSLDAFRGFIMLILVSEGFGITELAKRMPAFDGLAGQFEHHAWEWISFWDLIQPAFMFMVGVAMPFALAKRIEHGATRAGLFHHVTMRSLRLLLMSQILLSIQRHHLFFQLTNVLSQIALTYFLCYLILQLRLRWQWVAAIALLLGHWVLFVLFPGTEGPFYSKTTNIGAVIDHFIFGRDNPGYWVSLNFVTSTVTTLFGAWTGQLLASGKSPTQKMQTIGAAAVACLALGLLMHPWNPIIKRICTSSFTIYSTGWILLMLLAFYWIVEVKGYQKWTFAFVVFGANSIFIYSIDMVLQGWLNKTAGVFTMEYRWLGAFGPVAQACTVLFVMWYLCYWLYRRSIFFKL
jgi:predicted acyltransferase